MKYLKSIIFVLSTVGCLFVLTTVANAQISVIGELARDYDAAPGRVIKGEIEVHNSADSPQEAKIYQTDYLFFHDGTNQFPDSGSEPRSNANWIQFSPERIIVPPEQTVRISYEITIPEDSADVDLDGSFWSMLMVEAIPMQSRESGLGEDEEIKVGLIQVFRYGVQLATHFRQDEQYEVAFADVAITDPGTGQQALKVSVDNTGNIFMKPDVWVELFDGNGNKAARREAKQARVYPGTSVSYWFDIEGVDPGQYEALIVVDAGGENVFGAQYTLGL